MKGINRFATRCKETISNAPLDKYGEHNVYYCKGMINHLEKYLLPYAGLWTGIMLGVSELSNIFLSWIEIAGYVFSKN